MKSDFTKQIRMLVSTKNSQDYSKIIEESFLRHS